MKAPRARALVEVLLAFVLAHVAFRAVKRFTPIGAWEWSHDANLSAAAAMVVLAFAFATLRGRGAADLGLSRRGLGRGANAALLAVVVYATIGAIALAAGLRHDPTWSDPVFGLLATALTLLASFVILAAVGIANPALERTPPSLGIAFACILLAAPFVLPAAAGRSIPVVAILGWACLGPIAEEIFFRGYAQGRLNEAFGRPWRLFGTKLGPGLFIAAALFGSIHALNTLDYFRGEGHIAWWWGLSAGATLFYGFLRERTGGIEAGAVLHAFINIAARLPGLLAGG